MLIICLHDDANFVLKMNHGALYMIPYVLEIQKYAIKMQNKNKKSES